MIFSSQCWRNCFIAFFSVITIHAHAQQWNPDHSIGSLTNTYVFNHTQTPSQLTEYFSPIVGGSTAGLSYQWEQSSKPLDGFTAISGATSSNYTFSAPLTQTTYFRRKTTHTSTQFVYSNIIQLQIVSVHWENENYVRTHTVLKPGITNWIAVDNLTIGTEQKLQSTTYRDALGRTLQQVSRETATPAEGTNTWGDMVSFNEYDQFGRSAKSYLPYTTTTNIGRMKAGVVNAQATYYTNTLNETHAYAQVTLYDNSPLYLPKTVKSPGSSWAASTGKQANLTFNTTADAVRIWDYPYYGVSIDNPVFTPKSYEVYPANTLYKTETIDENGKKVIEFTNKDGQLVLKKVQLADNPTNPHLDWICTYNVYDKFGLLRCTIEPTAVKWAAENNNWTFFDHHDDYRDRVFFYLYDEKGRMIAKKNPGANTIKMLYDNRNRLVFTQDGNQHTKDEWMVTLYDDLDRPVITALYKTTKTIAQLQTDLDNALNPINAYTGVNIANNGQIVNDLVIDTRNTLIPVYTATNRIELVATATSNFESGTGDAFIAEINPNGATTNYTENHWLYGSPVSQTDLNNPAKITVLSYHYYDNYQFPGVQNFQGDFNNSEAYASNGTTIKTIQKTGRTLGFSTGTKSRVLNTNTFLTSTIYYDDDGLPIQSIGQNIKHGTDVFTSQYHYDGRLLSLSTKHTTVATGYTNFNILTKYVFDKIGRVTENWKKIGTNGFIKISSVKYDDMGKIKSKSIDPDYANTTTGTNGLENFVYDYNIHGQLIGINKAYALKQLGFNKWSNYFGLYLGYDNRDNILNSSNLTGQLAGTVWTTQGDDAQRKFEYTYDNAGRFNSATFHQKKTISDSWDNSQLDFSVKGSGTTGKIQYDVNGNLLNMVQRGIVLGNNTPLNIDDLQYIYYDNGNLLKRVIDNGNAGTNNGKQGDFANKENEASGENYDYDLNGNAVRDHNKGVQDYTSGTSTLKSIVYNHLDKPEKIIIHNKGVVKYVYDAGGSKLQKIFTPDDGETPSKITTYIGAYTYEETRVISSSEKVVFGGGGVLKDIAFEEGRIRVIQPTATNNGLDWVTIDGSLVLPENKKGVFDYYIKDHLASVRMVLTKQVHQTSFICTQETARLNNNIEQPLFGQQGAGNEVIQTNFAKSDIPGQSSGNGWNNGNIGNHVTKLSKLTGHLVGPNALLKVMAGDAISTNVQYFYKNAVTNTTGNNLVNNVLGSLVLAITGSTNSSTGQLHGSGTATNIGNELNSNTSFVNATAPHASDASGNLPKAYLNVLFFDERFNFVPEASTYLRVTSANNSSVALTLANIKAPKNGYVYAYVSNESDEPVYFDNFRITHTRGHIQEESHYYAFGLKIAGISSRKLPDAVEGSLKNENQYQGSFSDFEEELDWHDFELRTYDPQIGRWLQQDPYDEFSSPYVGMGNDPVNLVDPNGGSVYSWIAGLFTKGAGIACPSAAGHVAKEVFKGFLTENLKLAVVGLSLLTNIEVINANQDLISRSVKLIYNNLQILIMYLIKNIRNTLLMITLKNGRKIMVSV